MSDSDSEVISSDVKCAKNKLSCKNCVYCCFVLLGQYNLYSSAYSNIYMAYRFILTLSCTQVACERSFSKLEIIKNRLRNSLTQDNLQSLILMSIEKDILVNLNNDKIIDQIKENAPGISKYLAG